MVTEIEIKTAFERVAVLYSSIARELKENIDNKNISSYEIDAATKYSTIFEYESDRTKNERRYNLGGVKSTLNCFLRNYQREFSTYDFAYNENIKKYVRELDGLYDLLTQYQNEFQLSKS